MSPRILIPSCIAAAWALCLLGAVLLHPLVAQSTQVYRLGFFSGNILSLVHGLQVERTVSAGLSAPARSQQLAELLTHRRSQTDAHRHIFEKSWGRFNSVGYGPDFTRSVEAAVTGLAQLEAVRSEVLANTGDAKPAIDFYTNVITQLIDAVSHLETLRLTHEEAAKSRAAYLHIVETSALAAREMALGAILIASGKTANRYKQEWDALSAETGQMLSAYGSLLEPSGLIRFNTWNETPARTETDKLRDRMRSAFADGRPLRAVGVTDWIRAFEDRQIGLFALANNQLTDLLARTGNIAAFATYFFVTFILLAGAATLGAIAWHRPDILQNAFLFFLLFFNTALIVWALSAGPDWLADEGGPLESLQLLVLAATFVLFFREAAKYPDTARAVAVVLAAGCFLMFYREIDLRIFDAPEWLINITSGPVRRLIFMFILGLMLAYAAFRYKQFIRFIRPSVIWKAWPLVLWFVLLVAGELVEAKTHDTRKDDLHGFWANGQFWEELLELNAYLSLLIAACNFGNIFKTPSRARNTEPVIGGFKPAPAGRKD